VRVLLGRIGIERARIVQSGKGEALRVVLTGHGSWARGVRWDVVDPGARGRFGCVGLYSARCRVWILGV
jgi:hypothetical protein